MAGGPLHPYSVIPVSSTLTYNKIYDGDGATEDREYMHFIDPSVADADGACYLVKFQMPVSLPTGSPKFRTTCRSNSTTGTIGLNIKTGSVDLSGVPDDLSLTDEGSLDFDYSATANAYMTSAIDITTGNVVADEIMSVLVEIDDSAYTVAVETGFLFSTYWE